MPNAPAYPRLLHPPLRTNSGGAMPHKHWGQGVWSAAVVNWWSDTVHRWYVGWWSSLPWWRASRKKVSNCSLQEYHFIHTGVSFIKNKKRAHLAVKEFCRYEAIMNHLYHDNAPELVQGKFTEFCQLHLGKLMFEYTGRQFAVRDLITADVVHEHSHIQYFKSVVVSGRRGNVWNLQTFLEFFWIRVSLTICLCSL